MKNFFILCRDLGLGLVGLAAVVLVCVIFAFGVADFVDYLFDDDEPSTPYHSDCRVDNNGNYLTSSCEGMYP